MKILITGATGLIGAALTDALKTRGHQVVLASRHPVNQPGVSLLAVDLADVPGIDWWIPHLYGIDAVVNAAGIFQQEGRSTFDAVHRRAPVRLFMAAAAAGVPLVVQLSALGSDEHARTEFQVSKRQADETLRELPVRSVIVQPSLVYAPWGASARLFNQLALLPVHVVPQGDALVQPVHLQDVVDALVRLIEHPPGSSVTVHAVGPEALTLQDYLSKLRAMLGLSRRPLLVALPMAWMQLLSRLFSKMGLRVINPDAIQMLSRGNHADASEFARCLGRAPRPVEAFVQNHEQVQVKENAWLHLFLVSMRLSVAIVWIVTGLLSLGFYPLSSSLRLLSDFGLQGRWAFTALYLGAVTDLVLGLAALLAPRRLLVHVWRAQLLVMAAYTVLITVRIPEWWLHPFGPVLKNIPLMAATAMLAVFSRRR